MLPGPHTPFGTVMAFHKKAQHNAAAKHVVVAGHEESWKAPAAAPAPALA
jgi:hypothetical protein